MGKADQVFRGFEKVSSRDPTPNKAVREKTWRARQIRFSGVSKRPAHEMPHMTRSRGESLTGKGRSGFQGFRKAAPGAHLKDDICLSDACLNGLLPNFCDTGKRAFPDLFPNKNQFRTLINKFPRWCYFMRLSRVKGVFFFFFFWKECFNLNSFAGSSLAKCIYALGTNMHDCL